MKFYPTSAPRNGFSLIELIVAMTIFSVIMVLALQLTSSATNSVRISESRAFNDSVARQVFDQIGNDISQMIVRDDTRIEFETSSGNDQFSFLTGRRGLTATAPGERPVALVTYLIESDPQEGEQLKRGTRGHDYSDSGNDTLVLDPDEPFPNVTAANTEVISNNVLRMEVEYLVEKAGQIEKETLDPSKLEGLRGIVVSLVTMDDRTRSAIKTSRLKTVAGQFGDAVSNKNTLETWTDKRNKLSDSSGPQGISKEALKNIRCYQRTFLIP